jgi:sugar phosphate isomerase/epimerase
VIDLPRIRRLVEAAGYDGPIEVEVINPAMAELATADLMNTVIKRFERCC